MQTLIKVMMVLFCMNLFLYVGLNMNYLQTGNFEHRPAKMPGDIIDVLMVSAPTSLDSAKGDIGFGSALTEPSKATGEETGLGGIAFLDALRIIWSLIPTFFNVAAAGITLFFVADLPPIFAWMIGVPMILVFLLTIFAFIRGVPD